MPHFDSTIKLLDTYQAKLGGTPPPNYNGDLLSETRERLRMLSILYSKVCELHDKAVSSSQNLSLSSSELFEDTPECIKHKRIPTKEEFNEMHMHFIEHQGFVLEMKMYAESFYYFAARIRKILIDKKAPLPLLNKFEAPGIRNVRNLIIEHPGDLIIPSCCYGGAEGPKLKVAHYSGQKNVEKDRGFFVNVSEFKETLERLLNNAISELDKSH